MSSTSSTTVSATSSSPSPSATVSQQQQNNAEQQGAFYRNLFYILIGLLAAFAMVSFLSLLRARRRRRIVLREADRLGLIVPGMDGYIPLRDRQTIRWTHADGSMHPDWWEIGATRWMRGWGLSGKRDDDLQAGGHTTGIQPGDPLLDAVEKPSSGVPQITVGSTSPLSSTSNQGDQFYPGAPSGAEAPDAVALDMDLSGFYPLGVIPPTIDPDSLRPPKPTSLIPYFPHHLAYRAEDLLPVPAKWDTSKPETLPELAGTAVDLVTIIRMPMPRPEGEVEEGEEVLREWSGICLGVTRGSVLGSPPQVAVGGPPTSDAAGKGKEI